MTPPLCSWELGGRVVALRLRTSAGVGDRQNLIPFNCNGQTHMLIRLLRGPTMMHVIHLDFTKTRSSAFLPQAFPWSRAVGVSLACYRLSSVASPIGKKRTGVSHYDVRKLYLIGYNGVIFTKVGFQIDAKRILVSLFDKEKLESTL